MPDPRGSPNWTISSGSHKKHIKVRHPKTQSHPGTNPRKPTVEERPPGAISQRGIPKQTQSTAQQDLRINPGRLVSKLLDIFNIGARINSGMAVRAALTAQFQHT